MLFSRILLIVLAALLCGTGAANAAPDLPVTFGVEFSAIPGADFGYRADQLHVQDVAETFAAITDGAIRQEGHFYFIVTKLGQWTVHNDSGAVEASSPVLTLEGAKKTDEIAKIFEAFHLNGLVAEHFQGGQFGGGGHVHIGRNIFDKDPILLRNFWVEMANSPWLQTIFEETGDEVSRHMRETLFFQPRDVENLFGLLDHNYRLGRFLTSEQFARFVPKGRLRSHAVNLSNLIHSNGVSIDGTPIEEPSTPTVELRFPRAPTSPRQTIARLEFFYKYLTHLKKIRTLIPLRSMTAEEVAYERLPSVALVKYQKLVQLIDPENLNLHLEEWTKKYAVPHAASAGGGLEIRLATETPLQKMYEIKLRSQSQLDVLVNEPDGSPPKLIPLTPLGDNFWIGRVLQSIEKKPSFENWPRDLINLKVYSTQHGKVDADLSGEYHIATDYGLSTSPSACVRGLTVQRLP